MINKNLIVRRIFTLIPIDIVYLKIYITFTDYNFFKQ